MNSLPRSRAMPSAQGHRQPSKAQRLEGVVSGRGSSHDYTFLDYDEDGVPLSLFAHVREFPSLELLPPGTRVTFAVGVHRGRPCAVKVWPLP
jgi:hypothetical protein